VVFRKAKAWFDKMERNRVMAMVKPDSPKKEVKAPVKAPEKVEEVKEKPKRDNLSDIKPVEKRPTGDPKEESKEESKDDEFGEDFFQFSGGKKEVEVAHDILEDTNEESC
jgi:hypothetical protein